MYRATSATNGIAKDRRAAAVEKPAVGKSLHLAYTYLTPQLVVEKLFAAKAVGMHTKLNWERGPW